MNKKASSFSSAFSSPASSSSSRTQTTSSSRPYGTYLNIILFFTFGLVVIFFSLLFSHAELGGEGQDSRFFVSNKVFREVLREELVLIREMPDAMLKWEESLLNRSSSSWAMRTSLGGGRGGGEGGGFVIGDLLHQQHHPDTNTNANPNTFSQQQQQQSHSHHREREQRTDPLIMDDAVAAVATAIPPPLSLTLKSSSSSSL